MENSRMADDNNIDNHVDDKISACLNLEEPISFLVRWRGVRENRLSSESIKTIA